MDGVGGLEGWRWIFIIEGIATIISGFVAAAILPSGIAGAAFLTDSEKDVATRRGGVQGQSSRCSGLALIRAYASCNLCESHLHTV